VKRLLVLAAVLAASALAVGTASAPARSLAGKCIPDEQAGVQIVNHVALIVYCGHAKLTLKEGTKVTHWGGKNNGMCLKTAGNLTVGFGKYTAILHPIALANSLVLIAPSPTDGTYRLGVLTVQKKGKKATVADKVKIVIKGKRSRGTFSGKFPKGAKFTGSFTCK
jgi:hypothetical protein